MDSLITSQLLGIAFLRHPIMGLQHQAIKKKNKMTLIFKNKMKMIKIVALMIMLCSSTISSFSANTDTLYVSPNPFDSLTVIHFKTVQNDTISLFVYNYLGKKIRTYFENTFLQSGSYSVNFIVDTLPNGIYFVSLQLQSSSNLSTKAIHSPVGINDNEIAKQNRSLFPNPTTGLLTIPYDGIKKIIVSDVNGHVLKSLTITSKSVSLVDLNGGTYLITILSDNEQIFSTQKIEIIK